MLYAAKSGEYLFFREWVLGFRLRRQYCCNPLGQSRDT